MKKTSLLLKFSMLLGFAFVFINIQAQNEPPEELGLSYYILRHTEDVLSEEALDSIGSLYHAQMVENEETFSAIYETKIELSGVYWQLYYADSLLADSLTRLITELTEQIETMESAAEESISAQRLEAAMLVIEFAQEALTEEEFASLQEDFYAYIAEKEAEQTRRDSIWTAERARRDSLHAIWEAQRDSLMEIWERQRVAEQERRDSLSAIWEEQRDSLQAVWQARKDSMQIALDSIREARMAEYNERIRVRDSLRDVYESMTQEQKDSLHAIWQSQKEVRDSAIQAYWEEKRAEWESFRAYQDSLREIWETMTPEQRDSVMQELRGNCRQNEGDDEPEERGNRQAHEVEITVGPNPTQGAVRVTANAQIVAIHVIDSDGNVVMTTTEAEFTIEQHGIFIIQVETIEGVESERIIVD